MGHVDVAHLSHTLPDGRTLLDDVSFRVPEGTVAALAGPNGAGQTTLIRLVAGASPRSPAAVSVSGGLGVMRQFIGGIRGEAPPGDQGPGGLTGASAVRDLLLSIAAPRVRRAVAALDAAEPAMMSAPCAGPVTRRRSS